MHNIKLICETKSLYPFLRKLRGQMSEKFRTLIVCTKTSTECKFFLNYLYNIHSIHENSIPHSILRMTHTYTNIHIHKYTYVKVKLKR